MQARNIAIGALVVTAVTSVTACRGDRQPPLAPSAPGSAAVNSDAALFALVTQGQPFSSYSRFPAVDVVRSGSSAHQPFVRVSLNATTASALQNGRLPAGMRFPDGSVIFKEVLPTASGAPTVYTVMYRDANNSLAGEGWLWAEYSPGGSVVYSVTSRGGACTGCHSQDQGRQNDLVRTFERQR